MGAGAVVTSTGDGGYHHLLDPSRTWKNNKRLIRLNAWIVLLLITSSTNGFDGSLMNALQALPKWQNTFHNPSKSTLGLLNAIQNIGSLVAYPFAPYLCDGIGRKKTIWLGALIMVVATVVQAAAKNIDMFMGARFLIGFGLTFAANAAPMLVTEIAYPPYRASLTSLYNSLWFSGNIVAAWTTFGTQNIRSNWCWRAPSALQGLPSIFQVALVLFCPESPRWLVAKGREAEALSTLAYYHADGNEQDPLVQFEYEEIRSAIEFDRTVAANVGYKSLFTNRGNLKRLRIIVAIAFFSQWSGNGLLSYYLGAVLESIGITNPTIVLLINGLLAIWNFAWAVATSFSVERIGRRTLFLTSTAGILLSYTLMTICAAIFAQKGSHSAGNAFLAFVFLYNTFYDFAYTPLIVAYTVEILPYSIRAKGFNVFNFYSPIDMNVLNFAISLSLIFNQYANPIALKALGWKYYIVYVVWLTFELVYVYLYIVETRGLSLEETSALFDGDEAHAAVVHAGQNAVRDDESVHDKSNTPPV